MTTLSPSPQDLAANMLAAQTITLAIFNRFGDGVIAAVVCEEFMRQWKEKGKEQGQKNFLIMTSPQLVPYLRVLCPSATKIIAFNKRNPLHWLKILWLKHFVFRTFDLGFNPNSFGQESRKLAAMAKKTCLYQAQKNALSRNLYDHIRDYFALPLGGGLQYNHPLPSHAHAIFVCPESSEARCSLLPEQLTQLLGELIQRYPSCQITLASTAYAPLAIEQNNPQIQRFFFRKTQAASALFLEKLQQSDLVLSVDTGPMHIAAALGKPVIGVFSKAIPALVLDHKAQACALRTPKLNNIYCEHKACTKPICLDNISLHHTAQTPQPLSDFIVIRAYCPYLNQAHNAPPTHSTQPIQPT